MIPLAVPNLTGNESRYLQECIQSNYVSSVGPFVTRFEKMVAELSGAKACVAVSSGTAALHLALLGIGVKRDDLVILPSFTFIASANAISHCGATPWLMDITTESWTLDARLLRQCLEKETDMNGRTVYHKATGRRVAAIMPVHTLGTPADLDAIVKAARTFGLPVVADGAAALGASYRNRPIMGEADLTVFSFNGNKTVTTGGGGAIVGNNDEVLKIVRHLSNTGRVGPEYDHDCVAYNYRMTNLEAAVGCAQLERLEELVTAKRRIRKRYNEAFGELPGVRLFPEPSGVRSACWFSGVVLGDPALPPRVKVIESLRGRGLDARPFWKPMHLQLPYRDAPRTRLPVVEDVWGKILILPSSTQITDDEQSQVIRAVKEVLSLQPQTQGK